MRNVTWKNILKEGLTDEEMLKALYQDWIYDAKDFAAEKERYSDGSDHRFSETYYAILDKLGKLDIIKNTKKIESLLDELEKHPFIPFETIDYPLLPDPDMEKYS